MNRKVTLLLAVTFVCSLVIVGCGSDLDGRLVFSGQTMERNTLVVSVDNVVLAGEQSKLGGVGLQGDLIDDTFRIIQDVLYPTPPDSNCT